MCKRNRNRQPVTWWWRFLKKRWKNCNFRLSPKGPSVPKVPQVVELGGFWSDKNSELLTYCDAEIKFLNFRVSNFNGKHGILPFFGSHIQHGKQPLARNNWFSVKKYRNKVGKNISVKSDALLLKWDPVLVATVAGKGKVSPKNMPKDQVKTPSPPRSSWTNSQAALLSKGFKTSSSAFVVHSTDDPNWRPQTSQKWGWNPFFTSVRFGSLKQPPIIFSSLELICQTRKLSQI